MQTKDSQIEIIELVILDWTCVKIFKKQFNKNVGRDPKETWFLEF